MTVGTGELPAFGPAGAPSLACQELVPQNGSEVELEKELLWATGHVKGAHSSAQRECSLPSSLLAVMWLVVLGPQQGRTSDILPSDPPLAP